MTANALAETERSTFRAAADTGLWDLFIALFVAVFAIVPLLSTRLGDFWSSAVFIPVWVAAYLGLRWVQQRVVIPRVGIVKFGTYRKRRLQTFTWVLLAFNLLALAVGAWAATRAASELWIYPLFLALIVLVGFSLAAYWLDIPRLFLYGLLLVVAALGGEVLFRQGYASHHGYPIAFGLAAVVIAATGWLRFTRQVLSHPPAKHLA